MGSGSTVVLAKANSFETSSVETALLQTINASAIHESLIPKTTEEQLQSVNDALEELKLVVKAEGEAARLADKMRRIEFALQNTHLVTKDSSFMLATLVTGNQYKEYKYSATPVDTEDVLKDILLTFRQGRGYVLDLHFIDLRKSGKKEFNVIKQEWMEAFRNKICDKLDRLLGSHPRFDFRSNGSVALYYT
jgi:hypothetical protein